METPLSENSSNHQSCPVYFFSNQQIHSLIQDNAKYKLENKQLKDVIKQLQEKLELRENQLGQIMIKNRRKADKCLAALQCSVSGL
jgi:regulator of replication initiation timing